MKKYNIIILKENNESIGEEAYKLIARALVNVFGAEACKVLLSLAIRLTAPSMGY